MYSIGASILVRFLILNCFDEKRFRWHSLLSSWCFKWISISYCQLEHSTVRMLYFAQRPKAAWFRRIKLLFQLILLCCNTFLHTLNYTLLELLCRHFYNKIAVSRFRGFDFCSVQTNKNIQLFTNMERMAFHELSDKRLCVRTEARRMLWRRDKVSPLINLCSRSSSASP